MRAYRQRDIPHLRGHSEFYVQLRLNRVSKPLEVFVLYMTPIAANMTGDLIRAGKFRE